MVNILKIRPVNYKKSVICICTAIAIVLTSACILPNSSVGASDLSEPLYTKNTELYNCDFSEQNLKGKSAISYNTYQYLGDLSSLNTDQIKDDFSKIWSETAASEYFWYAQCRLGIGVLPLGYKAFYNKMKTRTDAGLTWNDNCSVIPKAGVTYKVEYSYKNHGKVTKELTLGLAVGNIEFKNNSPDYEKNEIKAKTTIETYSKDIELSQTDWTDKTAYITVPEETVIDEKTDRLYITFEGGGSSENRPFFYVDNVKVTALAPIDIIYNINGASEKIRYNNRIVTDYNKTDENGNIAMWYEDAAFVNVFDKDSYNYGENYKQLNVYGKYESFVYTTDTPIASDNYDNANTVADGDTSYSKIGLDAKPFREADGNNSMKYYQSAFGRGFIIPGHKYQKSNNDNYSDGITVNQGITYKVTFRYKLGFEHESDKATLNEMKIGLILLPDYETFTKKYSFYPYKDKSGNMVYPQDIIAEGNAQKTEMLSIPKGTSAPVGWTDVTGYITIPENANLSTYNVLAVYANNGRRGYLYIDDVTVTALAPTDITYVLPDSNDKTIRYSDGLIKSYTVTDTLGNPAIWYEDEQYTKRFDFDAYTRSGSYEKFKLYGRYEKVSYDKDTVLASDNYDNANTVADGDTSYSKIGLDAKPFREADGNNSMKYYQSAFGRGFIIPGHKYQKSNNDNYSDGITVNQGITYKVTFRYKLGFEHESDKATLNEMKIGLILLPDYETFTKKYSFYPYKDKSGNMVYPQDIIAEGNAQKTEMLSIPKGTSAPVGWTDVTGYITIPENANLSTYNVLAVYANNGRRGYLYIDDVTVTALKDRNFNVTFETNGGKLISGGNGAYNIAALSNLPIAVINNGTFMGWYTDSKFTKPFNVNDYIESNDTDIKLYAKWHMNSNSSVITMDDTKYWQMKNGEFVDGRFDLAFMPYSDNGNSVLKYVKKYAASKDEEKLGTRGNSYSTSMAYASCIGIFDPDLTATGNYTPSEVVRRAETGKTYRITFRYKVNAYDAEHSTRGIQFGVYTSFERNQHLNRQLQNLVVTENGTSGWKTVSGYFTVSSYGKDAEVPQGIVKCNAFSLGVSGYGEVLVDDISLTDWDKEKATYIKFSTNGGDPIEGQEFLISSNTVLPKPVRNGYVFDRWYTDVKFTKPFIPSKYVRTSGIITLYAGYVGEEGVTLIDFSKDDYYLSASKVRSGTRLAEEVAIESDNGNKYLRRKLSYADKNVKKDNVYGEGEGPFGTYPSVIGLYYPMVTDGANWTYNEAAYTVKENEQYYISFKYKVTNVDTESSYPSRITVYSGVTKENSCHNGRKLITQLYTTATPSNGWQTAGGWFKIPEITKNDGNRLSLMIAGYGEIFIDDVKIIKLTNAVVFDTDGGTAIEPVYGKPGNTFKMPANPVRENSKFMGWYSDSTFQNIYTEAKIPWGVVKVRAKFLTYQSVQTFEDYNIGMSDCFETDYELNKKCNVNDQTVYKRWRGAKYQPENVRNGKVSVRRVGDNQYPRMFTLFDVNTPLTVGEDYVLTFWMKASNMFMSGDIQIVYSDDVAKLRSADVGWNRSYRGMRIEIIANTEAAADYQDEWLEYKYEFKARAKYVGLTLPGMTEFFIDDACITLASADDSYKRSIDGKGIKYEDWYVAPEVENDDDFKKLDIGFETRERRHRERRTSGLFIMPVWGWILTAIGSLAVLGGGTVTAVVLIKKRKKQ